MNRLLRIAARVAAEPEAEATPIDGAKVADLVTLLKKQLDLVAQSAQRDKPQRAMKLLEGAFEALQTLTTLVTQGHEEVEERQDAVEDKMDQVMQTLRPIRLQIH